LLTCQTGGRRAYVLLLLLFIFYLFLFIYFLTNLGAKRFQNLPDRSLPNFRVRRYVTVDVHSGIRFAIAQGTLPWQPISSAKSDEIGDTPSFLGLAFQHNGWQNGKADGRVNTPRVLSTSRKNLVNFGPLTPVFHLATI